MPKEMFLEHHRFAPELNTLHYGGMKFKVPGASNLSEAKHRVFKPCVPGLWVEAKIIYPEEFKALNNTMRGRAPGNRLETLKKLKEHAKERCGGGNAKLYDGRILPIPKVEVKFILIG